MTANRQPTDIGNQGADADERLMVVAGQSAFIMMASHFHSVPPITAFCNEHVYADERKVERAA